MLIIVVWIVIGGTGLLTGWYFTESIGRIFFWWAGHDIAIVCAVALNIFITLTLAITITKSVNNESRGAITASGRRIVGLVYGLPFQAVGLAIGIVIMTMVLDMMAYYFAPIDAAGLDGAPQGNVGNLLLMAQGSPLAEILLSVTFIVLAVVIGRDIARTLKHWAGKASKPIRTAVRLTGLGAGGSASFAGIFEEWRCRFRSTAGGTARAGEILLGGSFYDPSWRVGMQDDRGLLTLASSRAGKGRSAIIPNLLTWPGSALVIDPKGTNAAVTAARRGQGGGRVKHARDFMNQDVHILDPFRIVPDVESANYNPLSTIDLEAETIREDIDAIADALIVSGNKGDSHWDESARAIISGIIAHLLLTAAPEGKDVTLLDMRDVLRRDSKYLDEFFGEMMTNNGAGGLASAAAAMFSNAGHRERGSFFTTIMRNTSWLDSLPMQRILGQTSDFDIADLKTKPTTIYVVLPPELLDGHSRFMRLFVNLSLKAVARGGKGKFQTLFILDEFYSLGKLESVQMASSAAASTGLRLWPIVQNKSQLEQNYSNNWETFFANTGVVQAFGVNDLDTALYLQQRLGKQVLRTGVQKEIHNLRETDEIGRDTARELGRQIIFRSGDDPLLLRRLNYDTSFPKSWFNPDPDFLDGYDKPPTRPPPPDIPPGEPTIADEVIKQNPVSVEFKAADHAVALEEAWEMKKKGKQPVRTDGKVLVSLTEKELDALGKEYSADQLPDNWREGIKDAVKQRREKYGVTKASGARDLDSQATKPRDTKVPVKKKSEDKPRRKGVKTKSGAENLAVLDAMIGLDSVKQEVKSVLAQIRTNEKRKAAGVKVAPLSRHLVFTGNPGTGKTTVARIIADIYREEELLAVGHLVECGRENLVGKYIGHTASLVMEKCNEAMDGVMFIDEAYSLTPGDSHGNDFGAEAVTALMKIMEDNRDRIIVIAAGYSDKMEQFLNSNPGLKSRFGKTIHFPDYSPVDMQAIFAKFCIENDYQLSSKADEKVKILTLALHAKKGENFGNGRTVRNLFQACLEQHNLRLDKIDKPTKEDLTTLEPEDILDDVTGIE